jgi:hypothetical protein
MSLQKAALGWCGIRTVYSGLGTQPFAQIAKLLRPRSNESHQFTLNRMLDRQRFSM